jgi:hypothetical protein
MDRFTLELWQSCFALYAQQFIIDNNLYIGRIFRTSTSYWFTVVTSDRQAISLTSSPSFGQICALENIVYLKISFPAGQNAVCWRNQVTGLFSDLIKYHREQAMTACRQECRLKRRVASLEHPLYISVYETALPIPALCSWVSSDSLAVNDKTNTDHRQLPKCL